MEDQSHLQSSQGKVLFPRLERLLPHQQEVLLHSPQRFKVLIWHRRARKTTTAINEIVKQAHLRVGPYWHIFPTYGEAKNAIWRDPNMLFGIIPKELIAKVNESELVVYFKNGSYYQLIGADNADRLRGAGPFGVVFDEMDTQKNDVWPTVEPILRANGGWAWFIGTPKGKQKLFQLYNLGQMGHPEWKSWLLKASTSGIIPAHQLAESRRTQPEAHYNQEWECEFLEGEGAVFRNVREACTAVERQPQKDHTYVMGVDLAKVQDWTVITVYDRSNNQQVYQDRFQTIEWPFQKARIQAVAERFNRALVVLDATGIGDPIADDLLRAGVAVEPFKITEQTKKDLIEKLSIWIEQKKLAMLPLDETLFEFDNFSYEIGPTGKIRYQAREGLHDDIVLAHSLAVYSLAPLYKKVLHKEQTLIQEHRQKLENGYKNNDNEQWAEWDAA